ncbi:MAG: NUDIX domain-containing protein, partial [Hyphomicrobiaceae bacterium]
MELVPEEEPYMSKSVTPLLTVDCIAFDGERNVLLVKRKNPPFQGKLALPGGFVETGETVEDACRREFAEETGLQAGKLELVGVYSNPDRDPRGHVVTIAFATLIPGTCPTAGGDAVAATWVQDWENKGLAFDHACILNDAERIG